MKMQELERRTGVGREAIRSYLRHGLIPKPQRPKRTVAHYDERHVQAVRAVRSLVEESRLTLAQVASIIGGEVNGTRISSEDFVHLEQLVAARTDREDPVVALDQLRQRFPKAVADARALSSIGILEIVRDASGSEAVTITDAELVAIWGEMRDAGFDEVLNFEPTMLAFYVEAAKFVGAWEASTFFERVSGRVDEVQAAVLVRKALPLMLNFFGILRRREFLGNMRGGRARIPGSFTPTLQASRSDDP